VFANLVNHQELPSGVSSVNIPKISGGTTVAIQTTQNTALSQTDLTTTSVSSGISTIGGKQVVAQQLLDQSGIPFDRIILQDLAADYARQLDTQFIAGSGAAGQLRGVANACRCWFDGVPRRGSGCGWCWEVLRDVGEGHRRDQHGPVLAAHGDRDASPQVGLDQRVVRLKQPPVASDEHAGVQRDR